MLNILNCFEKQVLLILLTREDNMAAMGLLIEFKLKNSRNQNEHVRVFVEEMCARSYESFQTVSEK